MCLLIICVPGALFMFIVIEKADLSKPGRVEFGKALRSFLVKILRTSYSLYNPDNTWYSMVDNCESRTKIFKTKITSKKAF